MNDEQPRQTSDDSLTARRAYNLVTDTVAGPNVRLFDNLFQAAAIFICLLLGAGIGCLFVKERIAGALVGGFIGLLVGLFGSGIFLMLFRAIQHVRRRHD